jgi:circadian clock protein KaiB
MSQLQTYKFRLYVADDTQNSARAKANLETFCAHHLFGRFEIELIDILNEPRRALADGVLMTPSLVKFSPEPVQKIVGALSDERFLVQILGLDLIVL